MIGLIVAFCGFYVAGSDQQLLNDATQVVMMRHGPRTVLSMQNNYKGPPEAFAMVVPVPVVLKEGDVKTLTKDVFAHVEQMGAPRLVEYWEQDPCEQIVITQDVIVPTSVAPRDASVAALDNLGVKIEAKFTVGEYQIVILSAKDSTGLDAWLRQNKYNIPAGAEPLLRPYVESGMKFFVAKVDPTKVVFEGGRALLSPLRFHYDDDQFALPIRLGLANSPGTQDLIVNILAPNQRYEVANYPNVTIPTNIDVTPDVKDKFGAFYAALFDRTLEKHRGAVVTEYAWQATKCDPCPGPQLTAEHLKTLGADVLPYEGTDFVLTRLHARYGKDIKNDLVFKAAQPIVGGREVEAASGKLEEGASSDSVNNFQARYAIRYPWTGAITCDKPHYGRWGAPVAGPRGAQRPEIKPALDLAAAPRGQIQLANVVKRDVPEIDLVAGASKAEPGQRSGGTLASSSAKKRTGCGCQATARDAVLWPVLVGLGWLFRRRKR